MTKETFSTQRRRKLIWIGCMVVILPVICGFLHNLQPDQIFLSVFLNLFFAMYFFIYIERQRIQDRLPLGSQNDYSFLVFLYILGMVLAMGFSFLPDFCAPVMLLALLSSGGFHSETGVIFGVYFSLLAAGFGNGSSYEVIAYVMLGITAALLTRIYEDKENKKWVWVISFCAAVVFPLSFAYLKQQKASWLVLLFGIGAGVLNILFEKFLLDKLLRIHFQALEVRLDTIMDERYYLRREILKYSKTDYDHAIKTAKVAFYCAREIHADEKLAEAGGFYYRVGKLEGEPFIKNGVLLAEENCFPEALVHILEEYNGIEKLPTSLESAIANIADTLVTKFEFLDKDTFSTTWNRDIVVYQTMNEKSAEGLYDNSGLTMNQFLKIRDVLVKEDIL